MKTSQYLLRWIFAATLAFAVLPLSAAPSLKVGDVAPQFSGHDQDGHTWRLSRHLGKKLVFLYFYPKDDTAGCLAEACHLRDNMAELKLADVDVVGVSFDGKESHKKFVFKYNLDFPLLADTGGHIADTYGARMSEKSKMDRRISFLIGLDGKIIHITDAPDPAAHIMGLAEAMSNMRGK